MTASVELDTVIAELDRAIRAHAGGIEVVEHREDGVVRVRYTGMCTGCPLKPLTTAATVRPALTAIDTVTGVEVEGSAISEEAESRMVRAFASRGDERLSDSRNK